MRKQKEILNFLKAFLHVHELTPEFIGVIILGLFAVHLSGHLVFELLTEPRHELIRPFLALVLITALAVFLYHRNRGRYRSLHVDVDETRLAPTRAGIIWLFGPGRFDHLFFALEHHHKDGGALHCWLIMQNTQAVKKNYSEFLKHLNEKGLNTQVHPVYITQPEAGEAYHAVRKILEEEAPKMGLKLEDVIADITGGLKPLTAGMILAALTVGCDLEYVETERTPEGEPIPGTLRVVVIDLNFYISTKEKS
jgi:hypothetical protein